MRKLLMSAAALALCGSLADSASAQAPGALHKNLYGQNGGEASFSIAEIQGHNTVVTIILDGGNCFFEDWVDRNVLRLSADISRIRVVLDLQEFPIVRCHPGVPQPAFMAVTCQPDGRSGT
jgi:hypothetical protein